MRPFHSSVVEPHRRLARSLGHPGTTERNTAQRQPLEVSLVNPDNFLRPFHSSLVEPEPQEPQLFALAEPESECISVPEPDFDPDQR